MKVFLLPGEALYKSINITRLILQGYQRQTLVKYLFTLLGVYLSFPSHTRIYAEAGHQLGPPPTGRSVPLEPLE